MKKFLGVLILAALIPASAHAVNTITASLRVFNALTVNTVTNMRLPSIMVGHNLGTLPIASGGAAQITADAGTDGLGGIDAAGTVTTGAGTSTNAITMALPSPATIVLGGLTTNLTWVTQPTALVAGQAAWTIRGTISAGTPVEGNFSGVSSAITVTYN